ncbi:MAG: YybH family protein [Pyrinomonadaceae bacterium]
MKKFYITAILTVVVFSITGVAQSNSKKAVELAKVREAEVKATFDRLIEGINQVDVEKVMSVYNNDDKTLFFNYNGTATIGWKNMYENRKASYADRKNVSLEVTGLRIEILSPTSAYASCKWKQTQEYKGELEQSSGRMTLVFKKFGKDWKVIHLHTSPDSFPSEVVIPASEKVSTAN